MRAGVSAPTNSRFEAALEACTWRPPASSSGWASPSFVSTCPTEAHSTTGGGPKTRRDSLGAQFSRWALFLPGTSAFSSTRTRTGGPHTGMFCKTLRLPTPPRPEAALDELLKPLSSNGGESIAPAACERGLVSVLPAVPAGGGC